MAQKLDRRRSRTRRQQGAIVALYMRGLDVETISRKARVPAKRVEKTLWTMGLLASNNEQVKVTEMDKSLSSKIRTQADLKAWLEDSLVQLEELGEQINELKAQSANRRVELVEQRVEQLTRTRGMSYPAAFEFAVMEEEEREQKIKAQTDKAQRERVEAELEELFSPEQERLILGLDEEG